MLPVQRKPFEEDGLKSNKKRTSLPINKTSFDLADNSSPVTEEARYRLLFEEEFFDFDSSQHQMVEEEDHFSHFLEQRRNSLKRQYERFKRRSSSLYNISTTEL